MAQCNDTVFFLLFAILVYKYAFHASFLVALFSCQYIWYYGIFQQKKRRMPLRTRSHSIVFFSLSSSFVYGTRILICILLSNRMVTFLLYEEKRKFAHFGEYSNDSGLLPSHSNKASQMNYNTSFLFVCEDQILIISKRNLCQSSSVFLSPFSLFSLSFCFV